MDDKESALSRRKFLGSVMAVGATALSARAMQQSASDVEKAALHQENPDSVLPPPTDHANIKPFKHPFSFSHKRTQEVSWARQVTIEDLPIAKSLSIACLFVLLGASEFVSINDAD